VSTSTIVFLLLIGPVWLIAMWALLMMTIGALKDERLTLFRLFTGYFVQEPYNRKYLRVFGTCIAVLIGLVIVLNVLVALGAIDL
jgi:hypothetical protein